MGNEFKESGWGAYNRDGEMASRQERMYDKSHQLTFEETVEKLSMGAKTLVDQRRYVNLIQALLREHGSAAAFTQELCERIAEQHPEFNPQPEMIRAIAEELEREQREQH